MDKPILTSASITIAPKDGRRIMGILEDGSEVSVQWRDHPSMENGAGWIDNNGRYRTPIKWRVK